MRGTNEKSRKSKIEMEDRRGKSRKMFLRLSRVFFFFLFLLLFFFLAIYAVFRGFFKCDESDPVPSTLSRRSFFERLCCLRVSVVNQRYDPEVQCPGGFLGNNVLMRCNVPSFVRDHVTITSWLQEPSFNIYPSTMGGERAPNNHLQLIL